MDAILSFFTFIQGLGVSVMMPIIITIIGTALGAGFGKSLHSPRRPGIVLAIDDDPPRGI